MLVVGMAERPAIAKIVVCALAILVSCGLRAEAQDPGLRPQTLAVWSGEAVALGANHELFGRFSAKTDRWQRLGFLRGETVSVSGDGALLCRLSDVGEMVECVGDGGQRRKVRLPSSDLVSIAVDGSTLWVASDAVGENAKVLVCHSDLRERAPGWQCSSQEFLRTPTEQREFAELYPVEKELFNEFRLVSGTGKAYLVFKLRDRIVSLDVRGHWKRVPWVSPRTRLNDEVTVSSGPHLPALRVEDAAVLGNGSLGLLLGVTRFDGRSGQYSAGKAWMVIDSNGRVLNRGALDEAPAAMAASGSTLWFVGASGWLRVLEAR